MFFFIFLLLLNPDRHFFLLLNHGTLIRIRFVALFGSFFILEVGSGSSFRVMVEFRYNFLLFVELDAVFFVFSRVGSRSIFFSKVESGSGQSLTLIRNSVTTRWQSAKKKIIGRREIKNWKLYSGKTGHNSPLRP